jgi:hypothetical protein
MQDNWGRSFEYNSPPEHESVDHFRDLEDFLLNELGREVMENVDTQTGY